MEGMAEVDVHNGERTADTALRETVTQGQWSRVSELLKQTVSENARRWSVEESVKRATDGHLLYILPQCANDQVHLALKEAVTRRMWGTVSQLLARDVSDDIRRWAVKEAVTHARDEPLASVLLHCSDDQVAAVLTEAVHKHQWTCVEVLLARGVTEELAAWAVLEASKHATEDQLLSLLSYCPGEQTDTLLTQAVTRHLWRCVLDLLSQGQPSDSVCGRAIGEASKAASEWQLFPLLPFCPEDAYQTVLVETLRRGCWHAVDRLLEKRDGQRVLCAIVKATEDWDSDEVDTAVKVAVRYKAWMLVCHLIQLSEVSDEVCQYVLEYLGDHLDGECLLCVAHASRSHTDDPVLPQEVYSHNFVKMALEAAVSRKLWNSIVGLLPHNFITGTNVAWLVMQAVENADDSVLSQVLIHCTDSQLDLAVHTAVKKRLWPTVLKLLSRNISDATRAWAVEEAIEHNDDEHLEPILCHCTDVQLCTVLKEAIRKGFWHCMVRLCCRGKRNGLGPWIVEEASRHASTPILNRITRLLSVEMVPDVVLLNLLERDAWDAVLSLFSNHWPSKTHRKMILKEASKRATGHHLQSLMESLCTPELVEAVLPELLNRGEWHAIISIELIITAAQQQTIVQEASKRAAGNDLESMMYCFCTDSTVDLVLPNLLQRDQWGALLCLMDKHITDRQQQLVVHEACKRASGHSLHLIIESFCTQDLVESILPILLHRDQWVAVSSLKQHSLKFTQRMMIVQEACKHATGDDDLCAIIRNLCTKDMVVSVLPLLLERGQWGALLCLLPYQVTASQQCQIILAASKRADETSLKHFVRHCPDELLESVTTEAVQRGLWKAVVHLLSCRISSTLKKWAVDEAMKHAEDEAQFHYIVAHCTTDQLEQAVTTALGRHYWAVTERLLKRRVDNELVQRAVEEATKHADEDTLILMTLEHSNRLKVDPIITHAVSRGFWRLVKMLLEWSPGAGSAARQLAVEEALKRATEEEQMSIFPYCSDDQLNSVLTEAIQKGFWSIVLALLERGVSTDTRRMAVAEGLKHADRVNIVGIINYCTDDQLDLVLTKVVNRCSWICVPSLLSRSEVTEITRRWVVGEARKKASNDHFLKIVPFCTDDQVDSIVTEAVSRNLWHCVSELLRLKKVTDYTRKRAVEKASERAEEGQLLEIIPFCTDDQADSVLTKTVHRQLWRCAIALLRLRSVTDSTRRLAVENASKNVSSEDQLLEIIPFCTDDQADSVLTHTVHRQLWRCASELLRLRSVTDSTRRFTVENASKNVRNEDQLLEIVPFCIDDQADNVLMETVTRGMWRCVELLLKLSKGTDNQRRWAMRKAMDFAPEQKIPTIFAYCDDDNLVVEMFQKIVERGFVCAPNDLLKSGLTDHKKQVLFKAAKNFKFHDSAAQNAVRQSAWTLLCFMIENTEEDDEVRTRNVELFLTRSRYFDLLCSDDEFSKIIQHCHPTQLLIALQETVKQNLLSTACDIVKRMGRHGDPLATTDDGNSVLVLAMKIQDGLRQLVAECIKLGISTHQPDIEASHVSLSFSEEDMLCRQSAFRHAALKNDVMIAHMLYESGACSSSQLYKLHADFVEWNLRSDKFLAAFGKMSDFLEKMTSTPRSLQSACRLVISHRVGIGCTRQENVKHLPLPEILKNYVLFSDVTKLDINDAVYSNDATEISDVTAAIDDVTAKCCPLDYYDSDDFYLDSSDDFYGFSSGYYFDSSDEYDFDVSHDTYDTAFYDYFSD